MIVAFLLSGGVWLFLETVFFVIGIVLFAHQLVRRAITVRKCIIWALGLWIAPILTVFAWTMIGRPVFPKKLTDAPVVKEIPDISPDSPDYPLARTMSLSGALPFSADSSISYISKADEYFDNLFKDLDNAKESICIECYLIRRDGLSRKFIDLLCRKASEGVKVKVIFDDYGYDGGDKRYVKMIVKAGGEAVLFHNMTKLLFSPKKNCRDHRKTVVIDGQIAYQGGYNIGEEYLGKGRFGTWYDAAVRIEGPQSQIMLQMFADMWEYATKNKMVGSEFFHDVEPCGNTAMQILPGTPVTQRSLIATEYLSLIQNTRKRLWISSPYFVPTKTILEAMCSLALSGVDVRIIIPAKGDHPLVFWGNRKYASVLMKCGARVFEHQDGFAHKKTILADDRWCGIGSSNFDGRSCNLNFECNVLVYSEEFAKTIENDFLSDFEKCTEFTLDTYENRSAWAKIKTILATVFRDQL